MTPAAHISDGYLDVAYADKMSSAATLGLFSKVKDRGNHVRDKRVVARQWKRLQFESEEKKLVNLDGENCGLTPVDISCRPGLFRVFCN